MIKCEFCRLMQNLLRWSLSAAGRRAQKSSAELNDWRSYFLKCMNLKQLNGKELCLMQFFQWAWTVKKEGAEIEWNIYKVCSTIYAWKMQLDWLLFSGGVAQNKNAINKNVETLCCLAELFWLMQWMCHFSIKSVIKSENVNPLILF